ncbi:hypothetical protein BV25DRAFT_1816226 [Artomyces pyxidatus]|uniref:Uncharacterized protein n=1 Tax=Artomyces pyxidatus TaxID=48021 RepID=A0ACB8SFE7_9AGAM|nr:hypothetical protein BV25DRAFT_1816226 [Artomyces pyxidatus]
MRQLDDPEYAALVGRVREGRGRTATPTNAPRSDYEALTSRLISILIKNKPEELKKFEDAPIIVADRQTRDAINLRRAEDIAKKLGAQLHFLACKDSSRKLQVTEALQKRLRRVRSSISNDLLGKLPCFIGMKVMVIENLTMAHGVVNGAEGVVENLHFETAVDGTKYAKCVYVRIPDCGVELPGLPRDVVPIYTIRKTFTYKTRAGLKCNFSRVQLPLVPGYSYTDYKSQGRSLERAVLDIAQARNLQSVYVMLSRVKTLDGLAIMSWFPPGQISRPLSHEFRDEFVRLESLDKHTTSWYMSSRHRAQEGRDMANSR